MTDEPLIFIDELAWIEEPVLRKAAARAVVCGWSAVGLNAFERVLTREQALAIYGPEVFLNVAPVEPVEPRWLGIERNLPRDLPDPPPLRNRKERRRWAAKHRV